MHPYIAAAIGRERSAVPAFDRSLTTVGGTDSNRGVDRRLDAGRMGNGVAACLTAFVLGSIAQGAPFVLVAAELERRGVGTGWLAAVAAARLAPYLLCSPIAGALAGRYDTRTVFAVTGVARGSLIAALWIALRTGSPALVLVALLFVLVAVGTPSFPALMRAVRQRSPRARLDRTSAVAAGLESAAFVAGPALGGLLLLVDDTDSLLVCAAMMGVSAAIASFLRVAEAVSQPNQGRSRRVVRDAARCLLGPWIRPAIIAMVGVDVLSGLIATLLVRVAAGLDSGGERAFGLLSFASGLGAFAAFIALLRPIPRGRPLMPLITAGAAVGVLAVTGTLPVALLACCVLGASVLAADVLVISVVGRLLPGALVAPGFGVLDALMTAAMITGALVAPVLNSCFGLRPTLVIAAVGIPLLATCARRIDPERQGR